MNANNIIYSRNLTKQIFVRKISNDPSGFTEKVALFTEIQQITLLSFDKIGEFLAS